MINKILYRHQKYLKFNKNLKKTVTSSLFWLKMIFYDQTKNTSPWSNGDFESNFFFKFGFYASSYLGICVYRQKI